MREVIDCLENCAHVERRKRPLDWGASAEQVDLALLDNAREDVIAVECAGEGQDTVADGVVEVCPR